MAHLPAPPAASRLISTPFHSAEVARWVAPYRRLAPNQPRMLT